MHFIRRRCTEAASFRAVGGELVLLAYREPFAPWRPWLGDAPAAATTTTTTNNNNHNNNNISTSTSTTTTTTTTSTPTTTTTTTTTTITISTATTDKTDNNNTTITTTTTTTNYNNNNNNNNNQDAPALGSGRLLGLVVRDGSLRRAASLGCGLMGSTLMGSLQTYHCLTDLNNY